MTKPRILVCGEALYDVFVGEPHATGFAIDARIGGSAFNVAVGAARLGCESALLTGIADDVLGKRLIETLEKEGVSTAHIARKDARTTLALVALDDAGVAQYAFYGEGGADRLVTRADLPQDDNADACVFGCFSILTRPTGDAFLTLAARTNALVVLDPNVRLTVEGDLDIWRDRVAAFANHADIIKVSEDDLFALYGADADLVGLASDWLRAGVKLVAITHGGEGATFHSAHGMLRGAGVMVDVVDTVGAGDTFLAALLTALLEAEEPFAETTLQTAMTFALQASAMTCTRRGADLPRRSELG